MRSSSRRREGAGTLIYVGRFDLAEFAVVLEPDEPLRTRAARALSGMVALADALLAHAPPESRSRSTGRTRSSSMAGWSAAAASRGRKVPQKMQPPDWLVFGAMIRTVSMARASRA